VHHGIGQTTRTNVEQNVSGSNMDMRRMIEQMVAEERARVVQAAPVDPMEETWRMIAEELARSREQSAPSGVARPPAYGGHQNAAAYRADQGMNQGPTMQTGRDFGQSAMMGNSRFTVALPQKYSPTEVSWMLWKPQVVGYFEMNGLEGILEEVSGQAYSMQVHRYAIGTLQQISPIQDAAWMSTLRLKYAYEAWTQLTKAHCSRAELDMQKKLYEFESACQRESETVREWTIRLERQVTELNVMSKEAAKDNVMGYNEHRDTAVYESTHKFRLLNVRIDNQSHEAFIASLRCQIYGMDVKGVESALITYEQGREVQRAMSSVAGGPSTSNVYQMSAQQGMAEQVCYACNGKGHHWKICPATSTQEGFARLKAKNVYVPRHLMPRAPSDGPTRHDPNHGRGYGGRQYAAGRGQRYGRFSRGGRAVNDQRRVTFGRGPPGPGTNLA
jgi:hypothetical protein